MPNSTNDFRFRVSKMAAVVLPISTRSVRRPARILIPATILGLCLGCGGAKEPEMAGPPEGMELAKPVPPPKMSPAELKGSSADPANQPSQ